MSVIFVGVYFLAMNELTVGSIYRTGWDNTTARIIGLDSVEVFYDGFWPHNRTWTFSGNFKRKCYFYRTSRSAFEARSTYLDFMPLSEPEHQAFRPDLVMRLGRTRELSWNNFEPSDLLTFNNKEFLEQNLFTNKIVLIPYGNKGGLKKSTVVAADNENYFSCEELIRKAKEIQESINAQKSNGIGIYRIGFESGLPSFYIGEYVDAAKILQD
jgi:hypothetical protein